MRIFLTGATGFIGHHVARALAAAVAVMLVSGCGPRSVKGRLYEDSHGYRIYFNPTDTAVGRWVESYPGKGSETGDVMRYGTYAQEGDKVSMGSMGVPWNVVLKVEHEGSLTGRDVDWGKESLHWVEKRVESQ